MAAEIGWGPASSNAWAQAELQLYQLRSYDRAGASRAPAQQYPAIGVAADTGHAEDFNVVTCRISFTR